MSLLRTLRRMALGALAELGKDRRPPPRNADEAWVRKVADALGMTKAEEAKALWRFQHPDECSLLDGLSVSSPEPGVTVVGPEHDVTTAAGRKALFRETYRRERERRAKTN